jgi:hypothetical protein
MIAPDILGSVASYNTYEVGGEGYLWVENTLMEAKQNNVRWLIVGMHKNYISVLTKSDEIGAGLMNLFFSHKVDLVLQAHEHGYERSKQLSCAITNTFFASCVGDSDNSLSKGNGTVIIVLGTGGTVLRGVNFVDSEMGYFRAFDTSTFGFGYFVVSAEKLEYSFRRTSGGFFVDSFVIRDFTLSRTPTYTPSSQPSPPISKAPSFATTLLTLTPTLAPSHVRASRRPTTRAPSFAPSTSLPSQTPSHRPSRTRIPTLAPSTSAPSLGPSTNLASVNHSASLHTTSPTQAQASEQTGSFETSYAGILTFVLVPLGVVLLIIGVVMRCLPRKPREALNVEMEPLEEEKALQS